jgi:hypothetical protein
MAILYTLQNITQCLPAQFLCHYFLQSAMSHDPTHHADCNIHEHGALCQPPDERETNFSNFCRLITPTSIKMCTRQLPVSWIN